jgi:hypothetical protein
LAGNRFLYASHEHLPSPAMSSSGFIAWDKVFAAVMQVQSDAGWPKQ